jgi:hypothetical protein
MPPDLAPPRHTPYAAGQHRLAAGLAPLDPAQWFEPDAQWNRQMANKGAILCYRHGAAVAALAGSEPAQAEMLERMLEHLPHAHPALYEREPGGLRVRALHPGGANHADLSPIDRCGRLVQEDVCLMEERAGLFVLTAATLCAPSGWRLSDKLGQPLSGIHARVPGYEDELGRRVQRAFQGLQAPQPMWRTNWSLHTEDTLFTPGGHAASPNSPDAITAANAGETVWVRVERQTLTRLARTGAIAFTIKTHIDPLAALAGRRDLCAGLKGSIESMHAAMQDYKSFSRYKAAVLGWLDAQIGA